MSDKKKQPSQLVVTLLTSAVVGTVFGFTAGFLAGNSQVGDALYASMPTVVRSTIADAGASPQAESPADQYTLPELREEIEQRIEDRQSPEDRLVEVVKDASPAVVSVVVSQDVPIWEKSYRNPFGQDDFFRQFFGDSFFNFGQPQYEQKGTEKKEVGAGTGFIVSADGYIITNKHVVYLEDAEYTVIMGDETKHQAEVVGRDPVNDIAVLKISSETDLPFIRFGDSDSLDVGQTVVAIGFALGEFENSVSKGIISGLQRSITASSGNGRAESLYRVIQTDAAINPGNSGGPLLDLKGRAVGINVAMARGAQGVGFALPANDVKKVVESVRKTGRIQRPLLGIRYVPVTEEMKKKNQLSVDYGVLVARGAQPDELAVMPGSPADLAGLVENDIILEIDGQKVTADNPLPMIISEYSVGDTIKMKVLSKSEEKEIEITLTERE